MTSRPELLARRLAMASMAISAGLAVVKIAVGLIAELCRATSDGFDPPPISSPQGWSCWRCGSPPNRRITNILTATVVLKR